MNEQLSEILRLMRNLIRIGTVSAVKLDDWLCRVDTGNNTTGWLHWLSARAGKTRSWNAPSLGEQVLFFTSAVNSIPGLCCRGSFLMTTPPHLHRLMHCIDYSLMGL